MSFTYYLYALIFYLYALICHSYVSLMYSYVIHMSLVCTRLSSLCHSYVLVCHPYVPPMWFYHESGVLPYFCFMNNIAPLPHLSCPYFSITSTIQYPSRILFQHFEKIKTLAIHSFNVLKKLKA